MRDPDAALLSHDGSARFYEERYESDYMDAWDAVSVAQVIDFIDACKLPSDITLLDFGCGTGEFTGLLQRSYSFSQCTGTDLSNAALRAARAKYDHVDFIEEAQLHPSMTKFDVIFTHHVLEHVYNIDDTLSNLADLLSPNGHMIHILPCGNYGSLEERLCRAMRRGKNPQMGNRFVFEDKGHVRRLRSDELARALAKHGLEIRHAWFANHYWGAIQWLVSSPAILSFPKVTQANSFASVLLLAGNRLLILFMGLLCGPAAIVDTRALGDPGKWSRGKSIAIRIARVLAPISLPFYRLLQRFAQREWDNRRTSENGSLMFLHFQRGQARKQR